MKEAVQLGLARLLQSVTVRKEQAVATATAAVLLNDHPNERYRMRMQERVCERRPGIGCQVQAFLVRVLLAFSFPFRRTIRERRQREDYIRSAGVPA